MLLEGPAWMERLYSLLPEEKQPRVRAIGRDIYQTIGGYVTGNLAISLIAGIVSTIALVILGVPYAVALGLLVAILDLIPLAGATIAAILVTTVAFLDSTTSGIIILIFFVIYQQVENHHLAARGLRADGAVVAARCADRGTDRLRARRRDRSPGGHSGGRCHSGDPGRLAQAPPRRGSGTDPTPTTV